MAKMHELLAAEPNVKVKAEVILKEAINTFVKKQGLFDGIIRTYQPKDDEGEQFPAESKELSTTVLDKLDYTFIPLIQRLDLIASKEITNTVAKADITINGKVLIADVPATSLLAMEKEVKKWRELLLHVLTLEPGVKWHFDTQNGYHKTNPVQTLKGKKIDDVLIKYPATKEHPAQTEVVTKDIIVGTWETIKLSGAIPAARKAELLNKVDVLEIEIKAARQRANCEKVNYVKYGKTLADYIFKL